MPAKIFSTTLVGLDSYPVEVEVDLSRGLHNFSIVGLPDKAVEESKERVGSAIKNSNLIPPKRTNQRVVVNLAPANLKKEGPKYDLPIALSYLLASGQIFFDPKNKIFVGELSLDGKVRPVNGILPTAIMAREKGFEEIFVPWENRLEASLVKGLKVLAVKSLREILEHLLEENILEATPHQIPQLNKEGGATNFSYIKGQENVKRALEIAASGGHNILMSGPPGSGKTLLSRALVSVLPKMELLEILEVTKIFSVAGLTTGNRPVITKRPFRTPHHSASTAALVGGGSIPKPGEITLAHRGVLFLDEFPEFNRSVLESLRQPLEDGIVTISRVQGTLTFPAKFMLIATMNPCPCGFLNDPKKSCLCTPYQIERYRKKLSGPLLDRIDLHINVPRVDYDKLSSDESAEPSEVIRQRVERARIIQSDRFRSFGYSLNSEMGLKDIKNFSAISKEGGGLMRLAVERYGLSARAYHRVLKIARTIADLDQHDEILPKHLSEALQFRVGQKED